MRRESDGDVQNRFQARETLVCIRKTAARHKRRVRRRNVVKFATDAHGCLLLDSDFGYIQGVNESSQENGATCNRRGCGPCVCERRVGGLSWHGHRTGDGCAGTYHASTTGTSGASMYAQTSVRAWARTPDCACFPCFPPLREEFGRSIRAASSRSFVVMFPACLAWKVVTCMRKNMFTRVPDLGSAWAPESTCEGVRRHDPF